MNKKKFGFDVKGAITGAVGVFVVGLLMEYGILKFPQSSISTDGIILVVVGAVVGGLVGAFIGKKMKSKK